MTARERPAFVKAKSGLPDGLFSKQKIPNLGKFWRAIEWKMLVYFMTI
jgi:hypothetical protein